MYFVVYLYIFLELLRSNVKSTFQ